jgi:hypothetical protein
MARWAEFDALVERARDEEGTGARAVGHALMDLMDGAHGRPGGPDWLDFERDKALRLLGASRAA